jgi:diguanylate cyclase (GGDEF)-like protein
MNAALLPRLRGRWTTAAAVQRAAPLTLSRRAWAYYVTVAAAAIAAVTIAELHSPPGRHGWGAFAVFTAGAAVAQLYIVEKGGNQSYRTALAFIVAAAVVLPSGFVPLLIVLHYIPSWLKFRKKLLVQTFNLYHSLLSALAAGAAFHAVANPNVVAEPTGRFALAGVAACGAFVLTNHVLLAGIIVLANRKSIFETGLFSFESLSTDFGLAALGIGLAAFWSVNTWLVFFVLSPLLIIHRALYVPQLRELAHLDVKTGLLNSKEFEHVLDAEFARAQRSGAPVSLLMVDIDLLREINNLHGHLAGDVVIRGVADIFREQLRRYDVASRFGGEEFCLLLPDTPHVQAVQIAERIRGVIADRDFVAELAPEPLRATVSIGVATWPDDATGWKELVHGADLAAYEAKAAGRNRVVIASSSAAATA